MTTGQAILWWTILLAGVVGSALGSGIETGIYSLNRVRLHLLDHRGVRSARILQRLSQRPMTLLGTLLIANNIANYMGTSALVVILSARGLSDVQLIWINVLIITPVLFVFGETLPKDLFHVHADRLTYLFARPLNAARWFFVATGLLPALTLVSAAIMHLLGLRQSPEAFHPRHQVGLLVKEGVGLGLLSDEQSAMVERVLDLAQRRVGHEMVPWPRVIKVGADDPPASLWSLAERTEVSRFPVVDRASGAVLGIVSLYDALRHEREACPPIRQLLRPALQLERDQPLRTALTQVQTRHAALAIVVEHGRPVGIVSVKDLIEPITGELARW